MKRLITLDTNILIKLKYFDNMKTYIDNLSQYGELFITEVVLDELSLFFSSTLKKNVVESVSTLTALNITIDKVTLHNEVDDMDRLKSYISDMFSNRIIKRESVHIDDVYVRALQKIPPFIIKKESDQGIKDCILWLSILNREYSDFDEVVFISADGGFSKQHSSLSDEFDRKHNKKIKFFSDALQFEIHIKSEQQDVAVKNAVNDSPKLDGESLTISSVIDDYRTLSKYRDGMSERMKIVFLIDVGDDYNYNYQPRFHIYEKLSIPSLGSLITQIETVITKYIGKTKVSPYEIFKEFISAEYYSTSYMISLDELVNLLELLESIRNEIPQYAESFLTSFVSIINDDFYQEFPIELPF